MRPTTKTRAFHDGQSCISHLWSTAAVPRDLPASACARCAWAPPRVHNHRRSHRPGPRGTRRLHAGPARSARRPVNATCSAACKQACVRVGAAVLIHHCRRLAHHDDPLELVLGQRRRHARHGALRYRRVLIGSSSASKRTRSRRFSAQAVHPQGLFCLYFL